MCTDLCQCKDYTNFDSTGNDAAADDFEDSDEGEFG